MAKRESSTKTIAPISPEEYGEIIKGLELEDIRLTKASIDLGGDQLQGIKAPLPTDLKIDLRDETTYEQISDCEYKIVARYIVKATPKGRKKLFLKIDVSFQVLLKGRSEIDDSFWEAFKNVNLPVNIWPYLREFIDNVTTRMHIPPIVLPFLKRGV